MDGLLTEMRIAMFVCVYYSLHQLFPQHGWVAHKNENCNVCMCILFPWSPIFPTWRGLLREIRFPMSVCVYYSHGHVFPQTWRGFFREMRITLSVRVYFSLDHLFSRHGGGCWDKLEFQCLHVYIIPLITYFPKHEGGCSHKWEFARYVCVYYSLDHLFRKHGGGCSNKWGLQCLYVYIIPFITYFPNMDG